MRNAWNVIGMVIVCVAAVAFVIDKIYEWVASSKLMKMFNKFEPLLDKSVEYLEDELDD